MASKEISAKRDAQRPSALVDEGVSDILGPEPLGDFGLGNRLPLTLDPSRGTCLARQPRQNVSGVFPLDLMALAGQYPLERNDNQKERNTNER